MLPLTPYEEQNDGKEKPRPIFPKIFGLKGS
jgi:hypothetical protein